jgi:hypothetical protein
LLSENLRSAKTKKTVIPLIAAVLVAFVMLPSLNAQSVTTIVATQFTSKDVFRIPDLNGNISFAFNGFYTEAELEDNTWAFKGLDLNNTQAVQQFGLTNYTSLGNLKISATNSNVTVLAFLSFNFSLPVDMLAFNVEGWGTQTVNLGLNATEKRPVYEWSIITDDGSTFLAEGSGWKLLDDNSVLVNYGPGNLTVIHYYLNDPSMASLSFFGQHYVLIFTGVAVIVTVVLAAVISFRLRKRENKA